MPRQQIRIEDDNRVLRPFQLALDDKGVPIYSSHLLEPVHISIYSTSEEARYANLLPGVGSVYAQGDISGGMGKKIQVRREDPESDRYYYADQLDASVRGQVQKGPAMVTLTAPANSGPLSGFFILAGVPYLVLSRIITSWASDALTQAKDLTASFVGSTAAVYTVLGTETAADTSAQTGGTDTITAADVMLAQQVRSSTGGVVFLGRVNIELIRVGTVPGDVRLSVFTDLNGRPGERIHSARITAMDVGVGAGGFNFRFDTDIDVPYAVVANEPYWLVLDAAGTTAAVTIGWDKGTTDNYARGTGATSTDGGNTWINLASSVDYVFTCYYKSPTTKAFVGEDSASSFFQTTPDGTTYTGDSYRQSALFAVVGDQLVRDAPRQYGAIQTSVDGANWTESFIVGDVGVQMTAFVTLADALIVAKQDGIYAVDLTVSPPDVQQLYASGKATTNGQGACFWRGAAYVPFNGRLMAVEGDFTSGFTVHESVGIEALPEWDWGSWGAGRHVACVGTRFHLYSVVSTTSGGYKLFKSGNPLRRNTNGTPDPEWHGSLLTIPDGGQTLNFLAHYDPGGSGSPQLYLTLTSNNIGRIQLPRSFNPASDSAYRYDAGTAGDLYFPVASGNYPVHPKAWLTESVTFQTATPSDYAEMQYDDYLGEGWRRMPKGGQLFDTGALPYPRGLASRLLARRLRLVNSLQTASPLLHAFGVAYAMRHVKGAAMREITFTVVAEDGLSAADLGEVLGIGADAQRAMLALAAGGGQGTRRMEDPYGRVYQQVLFLDATEVLNQTGRDSGGRTMVQISAVGIG